MKWKEQKSVIVGLNGSGKTEFGKYIVDKNFKRAVWVLVNNDDLKNMPKNVSVVLSSDSLNRTKELDNIIKNVIVLAKENKVDALIIDEADLFLGNNAEVMKSPNVRDLIVLQRHHGLAVVCMSRRPQDLPTKLYETADNVIIFASRNSDNVDKKLKAIDRELPKMVAKLKKGDYKFIVSEIGEKPKLFNPIPLTKLKEKKKHETRSKKDFTNNENRRKKRK